jgi:phage shock protein A
VQQQALELEAQHADLAGQEEKLTLAAQRLQSQVEAFRTRKETIKASYTAAEAQTRINEAVTGISDEMGEVGLAIQRAEDKTQQLQARAGAIDDLIAAGTLDAGPGTVGGDVAGELARLASTSDVELEMTKLKAELGAGSTPSAPEIAAPEPPPVDK